MEIAIVTTFIIGYLAISFEHQLRVDKLIPALLMMVLTWTFVAVGMSNFHLWFDPHHGHLLSISEFSASKKSELIETTLLHHFGKTAEILIFLVGAMTIVEMIDHFDGFQVIKRIIKPKSKYKLLLVICLLAFVLSAIIDNLTATIVLITILRKLINDSKLRIWYASFVVIAANSGGAWTPIGDVTTTMLWIGGKVTGGELFKLLLLPSFISIVVPLFIVRFFKAFKGNIEISEDTNEQKVNPSILIFGLALIILVPIFKVVTHLPPYMGMMLSLSLFALIAEIKSKRSFTLTNLDDAEIHIAKSPTLKALGKIEMPSILFFLGILMTVAAMESLGLIYNFGQTVNQVMPQNFFVSLLGMASAVIDNVPLVAASMGMFHEAQDAHVWHFIAYAAGTGGSLLIIGSAAGVVAMGMEKIDFGWYLKHVTFLALCGYISGLVVFLTYTQIIK